MIKLSPSTFKGNALRRYVEAHLLPWVDTPAQYTGGEQNQIVKDHNAVKVRWDPLESTCRHASLSIL